MLLVQIDETVKVRKNQFQCWMQELQIMRLRLEGRIHNQYRLYFVFSQSAIEGIWLW